MKKIMALLLVLLSLATALVGCGSEKKSTAADTKQNTVQTNAPQVVSNKPTANDKANSGKLQITESKAYTDKEHVAGYINEFAKLPHNYITKEEAKKLGWQSKGTLDKVAPGKSIGGDRYGNYEGKLPKKSGRTWKECDIDYVKGNRNAKRLVFSNDGLIYYTEDHYQTFAKLY